MGMVYLNLDLHAKKFTLKTKNSICRLNSQRKKYCLLHYKSGSAINYLFFFQMR